MDNKRLTHAQIRAHCASDNRGPDFVTCPVTGCGGHLHLFGTDDFACMGNSAHAACKVEVVAAKLHSMIDSGAVVIQKTDDSAKPAPGPPTGKLTLAEYAMAKHIPERILTNAFGVTEGKHPYYDKLECAVCFPYWNEYGEEVTQQWRWGMGKGQRAFLAKKPTYLYGGHYLKWLEEMAKNGNGNADILLVEGESNTHTLRANGRSALGLPGVGNWQKEWKDLKLFEAANRIYFFLDMKDGKPELQAIEGAKKIADCFKPGKVLTVIPTQKRDEDIKDINDLWRFHMVGPFGGGQEGFEYDLNEMIRSAKPVNPVVELLDSNEEETTLTITDMPETVLDGRLGEICKERLKDFPVAYGWLPLVAACGVLVKPSSKPPLRASLYVGIVGPVGSGKSTAIERALNILGVERPTLYATKTGSAEGMLKDIGDVRAASRFWFPDELVHPLQKAAIQNASFPAIMNSLYYNDIQDLTIEKGKSVHFNARLTLVGGIPDDKFQEGFGPATTGGFYDRFLFGQCPSGFVMLHRPDEGVPIIASVEENDGFEDVLNQGNRNHPVEVPVNRDVWAWRDSMVHDEGISARILEHALRVAAICAAFDGRQELCAADLGPAAELARYQHRVRLLLKPNTGKNQAAECEGRIRRTLEKHAPDGRWVGMRWLDQTTSAGRDFGSGMFQTCLRNMAYNGEIELNLTAIPKQVRLIGKPAAGA